MEQSKQNEILTVAREAIRTEADALEKMERSLDEHFVEAIETILQSRGKLIITGMGKSGLIGRKMAATFASTGTPSFYLHPGEAFHGDLGMISKEDIVLAISYSGEDVYKRQRLSLSRTFRRSTAADCPLPYLFSPHIPPAPAEAATD